jgi:RNA polymerase nonessential primary-like sigma factor
LWPLAEARTHTRHAHPGAGGPGTARTAQPDGLAGFFGQLAAHPLLTGDEEVALARAIEAGRQARQRQSAGCSGPELDAAVARGRAAFDRFVLSNLRLVAKLAGECARRSGVELDDLIQDGCVGLVRAVEGFDWRRGTRFSTYATWWIRKALQQGVHRGERGIRLPAAVHDALVRVHAATKRLEAERGMPPDAAALAEATDLPVTTVRAVQALAGRPVSLDRPAADGGSPLGDLFAVAADDPAAEAVDRVLAGQLVARARDCLDERARHVLLRRFGLLDGSPRSLEDIAAELGVSRETVRLDLHRAVGRLRAATREEPAARPVH